jgi:hypothetical protein
MKRIMLGSAVVVALAFAGALHADDAPTVVVPVGDKPCQVTTKEVVLITAKGIAGSTIDVKVDGPAKDMKHNVVERAGANNVIGNTEEAHLIMPTDKGTIKVKVTVKPPNGDATVKEYEIEVK